MSTISAPPSKSPSRGSVSMLALLSLTQDPRQLRAWVSVTPNWLRAVLVGIVLLAALFALAIRHAAQEQNLTIKAIRDDSAPSIVAGQEMRVNLADMHSDLANELLAEPGKNKQTDDARAGFIDRREKAAVNLREAAQNITYPGEKEAVETVLKELPRYEEFAGAARVLHDQSNAKFLEQHYEADKIMRMTLLPTIETLVKINQTHLTDAYDAEKTAATLAWQGVLWSGGALLAAIIGLKVLLFKRMRRVVNPPLLAAAALTALGCLWILVALWQSSADIKTAKQDAFDSIAVLEAARAAAFDSNGDESRWLLVKIHEGDPKQINLYADKFREKAKAVLDKGSWRGSVANWHAEIGRTKKAPLGWKGYLADELNNITFTNELPAAEKSAETFEEYLQIDQQIRDLKDEKAAVALCLGTQSGQSNWAFDQFDKALGDTIAINQAQFKPNLDLASGRLAGFEIGLPLCLALGVIVLTFFGLRPRMKEYAVY